MQTANSKPEGLVFFPLLRLGTRYPDLFSHVALGLHGGISLCRLGPFKFRAFAAELRCVGHTNGNGSITIAHKSHFGKDSSLLRRK